jgi:hypothetical protein
MFPFEALPSLATLAVALPAIGAGYIIFGLVGFGTVFIAVAGPAGTTVKERHFAGDRHQIQTLAAYAGLCTLALFVWPGTKTRYAMPIAPAVAVMAGLAFGPLIQRRHWTAVAALAATGGLFVYQVVLVTVVTPHNVLKYSVPRRRAPILDAALAASPAPVFTIGKAQANKLFYLTHPIVSVEPDNLRPTSEEMKIG